MIKSLDVFALCCRAYYRVATLFHHTLRIQLDENGNAGEKQALYKRNIQKTIRVARKNFFLLVGIVIIFIIFWYPLFLLTIVDIGFKADVSYYEFSVHISLLTNTDYSLSW